MQQRTLKVLYTIHAWTGVICGLLLFVVCWSGTVALFHHELRTWETPALRIPYRPRVYHLDQLYAQVAQAGFHHEEFFLVLPTPVEPSVQFQTPGPATAPGWHIDPTTNTIVQPGQSNIAQFLSRMHTDLHLPQPWGRRLVGFSGVFLMLAVVSGVLTHRKLLAEMFTLRLNRSWRLWLSDSHKQLGVWGLPFSLMIGFTGTVLGLLGLIAPLLTLSAFQGDVEKAVTAFVGEHVEAVGDPKPMQSLDAIMAQVRQAYPARQVHSLHIMAYGDARARVVVALLSPQHVNSLSYASYSLVSGALMTPDTTLDTGFWRRLFATMTPLHYGTFAGLGLKLLYLLLGVGLNIAMVSGLLLWLERRSRAPTWFHKLLKRFSVGVCCGLVLATAMIFVAYQALPLTLAARALWAGYGYWAAWGLSIGYGLIQPDSRRAAQHLCLGAGLLFFSAAVLNNLMTETNLLVAFERELYAVAGVDSALAIGGLLLMLVACRWPQRATPRALTARR